MSSNSVVSDNDPKQVDVACAGSSNSLVVSNNDPKQHQVACAGTFNSVSGKKKNDVSLVHQYVVIYPSNAKFKWGMYNSIPAIMSMGCTGIRILKAIDGGLGQKCIDLCASKGTTNPSVFLNKWSYSIKRCIKRCTKDALTEIDIEDVKCFCIAVTAVSMKKEKHSKRRMQHKWNMPRGCQC